MFGILNSTLLWALAAVAVPILIHFLTRRKLRVVAVSTIAFLKRLERENIRRLKLRQLLLLLLRMLIVALLVLAFARPTLRQQTSALAQRARATAVIILDNSMSMASAPEGVPLLSQARKHAQSIASMFANGDELYLITAAQPAKIVAGSPYLESEKFLEAVNVAPQTWANTDLAAAFALSRDILSRSRNVNRELYLLSDNRAALAAQTPELPGVRAYALRYEDAGNNNLTLSEAKLANQIFERGKSFEVVATVANAGESEVQNQLVHLYLNGKRVAQQSVDVPASSRRSVTLRAVPDSAGFMSGRIMLDDDALVLDNTRYFTFHIPRQRRVLAVSERTEDLAYFRAVLRDESAAQDWKEIETKNFSAERLENYEVVVLHNVARFPEGMAARLLQFVEGGGGVIVFPGSEVDLRHYNETLFAQTNFGAFGETLGSLEERENFFKLGQIDFSHPLFANVFEKNAKGPQIESPQFRFAVQLRMNAGTKSVMDYANAHPFLAERQIGRGKMLVFTSTPEARWSDLAFKGLFAPLLYRSAAYVTQSNEAQKESARVGEELTTILRASGEDVSVTLPNGERLQAPVNVVGQNYHVRVRETDLPGFYTLLNKDQVLHKWAVNFSEEEMNASPAAPEKLAAALGVKEIVELPQTGDLRASIESARYGSELWRWFLLAAIIAMIVEMLLYRGSAAEASASTNKTASTATHARSTAPVA
ncbi:BatA domain-containing protein [candidate division KSB1 bacterium]|nr:BatA domain-containing protein [candidate division KSB1 bacterium]